MLSLLFTFFLHVFVICLVYWVLESPVVFGESATLTCIVEQKDHCDSKSTRRWDRDQNILLINGHSTNASKYFEVADQPCYNFSLVIMNFGITDVNCEYRCTFEFETSRKMLTLDSLHFIGMFFNIFNLKIESLARHIFSVVKCVVTWYSKTYDILLMMANLVYGQHQIVAIYWGIQFCDVCHLMGLKYRLMFISLCYVLKSIRVQVISLYVSWKFTCTSY